MRPVLLSTFCQVHESVFVEELQTGGTDENVEYMAAVFARLQNTSELCNHLVARQARTRAQLEAFGVTV